MDLRTFRLAPPHVLSFRSRSWAGKAVASNGDTERLLWRRPYKYHESMERPSAMRLQVDSVQVFNCVGHALVVDENCNGRLRLWPVVYDSRLGKAR
jgi:hypothetical protein